MKRSTRTAANASRTKIRNSRRLTFEQLAARRVLAVAFGDFNNDGYDDMAAGVPGEDVEAIADAGAVNVIYGSASGLATAGDELWHQDVDGVDGVAEAGDRFGATLAVGDFDNDGYDDLAIGAPGEDVGDLKEAGAVNILYGSAGGLTTAANRIFHQDVNGMQEIAEQFDRFGAVLTSGDFDGDGYDDLAIGVPNENIGVQQDAGIVQILYGSLSGLTASNDQIFQQGSGGMLGTAERYDHFGAALTTGDFNGDGYDDLGVGTPGEDTSMLYDIGEVDIIYGTSSGLSSTNNKAYTQDSSGVPSTAEAWDNFGSALAAGDFDNDGRDDLAIGTPNEDHSAALVDAGVIHVMYGRASYGFDPARHQMWHQDSEWIEGVVEAYDYYGSSLATGDFNGDGRDDLAIGVPGENVGDIANAGAVNIMYGRAEGLNYWNDRIIHQDQTSVAGVAQAYDYFGTDVATGDTNNDGYADLGVAIPWGNDSGTANAGAVHVFRGRSDYGLRTDNDYIWHQDVTNIDGAAELNDFFGGEKPQSMDGGVPKLESKPGATKHLFLDFDGGWSSGIYTTYFKLDDQNTANWTERSMIEDIWAAVAEDFAPFNINVTTFLPSAGEVFRVLIGGDGSERQDDPTSGWGPGDYTDASDDNNDVYVYSARIESWYNVGDNLAQRVATTASHEAGHGFGLGHKSTYHAFGALLDEYSDGAGDWTPIMGGNLSTDRTIWMEPWVALTVDTHAEGSDDFAVLQSELGLRSDDHASSTGSATNLGSIGGGGMLMDTGIIRTKTDVDTFKFTVTTAGSYNISLAVADVGANLNSTLKLRNSGGTVIATHSPTDSLGASITRTLAVGTYYINVGSEADSVGDVGQFTLRVQPGLVIAIPTEFVFAGVSGGSIGRIGAGDAPVIIDQPTAPLKTLLPVAKGDSPAGAGAPSSQAAIDALMAEWSQAGQKRLQKVSDWFGAHSWSDATDAAFA